MSRSLMLSKAKSKLKYQNNLFHNEIVHRFQIDSQSQKHYFIAVLKLSDARLGNQCILGTGMTIT